MLSPGMALQLNFFLSLKAFSFTGAGRGTSTTSRGFLLLFKPGFPQRVQKAAHADSVRQHQEQKSVLMHCPGHLCFCVCLFLFMIGEK